MRPRMLDLFCGEGGAGEGYARAGFDVFGVDNDAARLASYPYPHVQADAIEYLLDHGHEFDAIHASPTCTGYSRGTVAIPDRVAKYPRLIAATRAALVEVGRPYVIENVEGARRELDHPTMLCWSMFRDPGSVLDADGTPLTMERHRLFETSFFVPAPGNCQHRAGIQVAGAYGGARRDATEAREVRHGGYVPANLDVLRSLTGLDWATERGCFLSIPPDFTEYVGRHLLAVMEAVA